MHDWESNSPPVDYESDALTYTPLSHHRIDYRQKYNYDTSSWSSIATATVSSSLATVSSVPFVNNAGLLPSSVAETSGREMKMVPGLTAAFCVREVMYWNMVLEDQPAVLSAMQISNTQRLSQIVSHKSAGQKGSVGWTELPGGWVLQAAQHITLALKTQLNSSLLQTGSRKAKIDTTNG